MGLCYRGTAYNGWQSQPDGASVQDAVERALSRFADSPVRTICAGRTDASVHGLNQVVHFDAPVRREAFHRRTREDARAYAVKLTDEGKRVLRSAEPLAKKVDERILDALSTKQRDQFIDDLLAIVDTLQKMSPQG